MTVRVPRLATLVAVLSMIACSGGGSSAPTPVLTTIIVALSATKAEVGQSASATASGADQSGQAFTLGGVVWSSSAPSVATVSSSGALTAVASGQTNITATVGTVSGTQSLTVIARRIVASLTLSPAAAKVTVGRTQQFTAVALDAAGNPVTNAVLSWSTSSAATATTSQTGLLSAAAPGRVVVTASVDGAHGTVDVVSVSVVEFTSSGATGYLSAGVAAPAPTFQYGYSGYSSMSQLGAEQVEGAQFGWGSWLIPDNRGRTSPLCPVGTYARDHWPERGPSYSDVYETIEGGAGQWGSTLFPSAAPKFRLNSTGDCYSTEVASPGFDFGMSPLASNHLDLAQLSNRLLVAPDGLTVVNETAQALLGFGWIALPLIPAVTSPLGVPTGNQSWTLFLSATNFRGPVAFYTPEHFSDVHAVDRSAVGRGLDAQPSLNTSVALEVGNIPMLTAKDATGTRYRRIAQVAFGTDAAGQAMLLQDIRFYAKSAFWDAANAWIETGTPAAFDNSGIVAASLNNSSASLTLGGQPTVLDSIVTTGILSTAGGGTGIGVLGHVLTASGQASIPEYFKEVNGTWVAVPPASVPVETGLADGAFAAKARGSGAALDQTTGSAWAPAGWAAGPFSAVLNDGSTVDYVWYRFIDQPAILRLGLSDPARQKLQTFVVSWHQHSGLNGVSIAPPSAGRLATLDAGLFVTPPTGFESGYVPIVIRQH